MHRLLLEPPPLPGSRGFDMLINTTANCADMAPFTPTTTNYRPASQVGEKDNIRGQRETFSNTFYIQFFHLHVSTP